MRKPKTNWNALSEEAKMGFFEFWLATKFFAGQAVPTAWGEDSIEKPCSECPGEYCSVKACSDLCGTMFTNLPHNERVPYTCPCIAYGEKAVEALEQCLIEDGWIPTQRVT